MRHAYFLVLPDTHVLDLAGPLQIMATLKELGLANVGVECIGPTSVVRTFQTAVLTDVRPLPARLAPDAALFVVGGKLSASVMNSRQWLEAARWLRESVERSGARLQVCGVCTGAFLLAQAGLLDGRLCTTHHRFIADLRRRFPAVHVSESRVFVRDRNVWTSAGVISGVDLALHLVAHVFGEDAAVRVARENVVNFKRFSGDPELSAIMRYRGHCNERVHTVQDAIANDLAANPGGEELARLAGCSSRHLARIFAAETGITVKKYQIALRMDLAHRLLRESTLSLERIAERCGFASVQAFRANWVQYLNVAPLSLRAGRVGQPG